MSRYHSPFPRILLRSLSPDIDSQERKMLVLFRAALSQILAYFLSPDRIICLLCTLEYPELISLTVNLFRLATAWDVPRALLVWRSLLRVS